MSNRPTPAERAIVLHDLVNNLAESFDGLLNTTKEKEQRKAHMVKHMNQLVNECLSTCQAEVSQYGSGHSYDALRSILFAFQYQN